MHVLGLQLYSSYRGQTMHVALEPIDAGKLYYGPYLVASTRNSICSIVAAAAVVVVVVLPVVGPGCCEPVSPTQFCFGVVGVANKAAGVSDGDAFWQTRTQPHSIGSCALCAAAVHAAPRMVNMWSLPRWQVLCWC